MNRHRYNWSNPNELIHRERHRQLRERLYTPGQAARICGVSTETIRRWERSGKIYSHRTAGGQRRIPQSEINFILGLTRKDFPNLPKQPSRVKSPVMLIVEVFAKAISVLFAKAKGNNLTQSQKNPENPVIH